MVQWVVARLVMPAVRVLPVTSMVRALRVMSWVVAMLMWVLQVVCRLVAPLVLSLRRVLPGVLWAAGVVGGADGEGDVGDGLGDGEAGVCRR